MRVGDTPCVPADPDDPDKTVPCLFVIMDFEGLNSVERTEQEDVLLALFNAAISNATLFKLDFSVTRETQHLFARFGS